LVVESAAALLVDDVGGVVGLGNGADVDLEREKLHSRLWFSIWLRCRDERGSPNQLSMPHVTASVSRPTPIPGRS